MINYILNKVLWKNNHLNETKYNKDNTDYLFSSSNNGLMYESFRIKIYIGIFKTNRCKLVNII